MKTYITKIIIIIIIIILYIYNNSNNLMLIQPLDLHLHRSPVFRPGATPHSRPAETKGFS